MLKKLACLLALIASPLFAQQTPQAIPLTSAACKLDGTVGCGGGGGGSGDITSVALTTNNGISGAASCTTGACSFTLGLGAITATSFTLDGTGGAGFVDMVGQASAPSAPTGIVRFYADNLTGYLKAKLTSTTHTYWNSANMAIGTDVQAYDADLSAFAALAATPGILAKTAANTYAVRTITGTASKVSVTNGDGQAGDPVLTIPSGATLMATDGIWSAKGDIVAATGATAASRLAVGTNGQVLTADSTQATGVKWANPAGGGDALTTSPLSQFAATTSAQLAGVLSDEVGSGGGFLRATAPTMSAATVTGSLNVPHGTLAAIPATCVQGDVYVATDQTAGLLLYVCTATNTWTLVSPAGYPFSDANNLFFASGDATKLGKFDLSGITTGTTRTWTWPNASGTVTLLGNSSTGSGSVALATSPSFTTPSLGVATATSVNGTSIPSSKTLVVTTDKLSALAATTSAELAGVVSDEIGSGSAVFATKAQGPYLRGRIVSQTTDVTVANTTTETSIATGTLVGTNSIGANTAYAGETIAVYVSGYFSTTGTPNLTFTLKFGSTTVLTSTNATASGVSNAPFSMQATCTVRTTGASGTAICAWNYRGQGSSVANSTQTTGHGTSTTLDFTGALAPDVTVTWSAASASNTFTATQFYVERM